MSDLPRVTIAQIQQATAAHFGLRSPMQLVGGGRTQNISKPRQIAMYLAHHLVGASYPAIGRRFGNRHHATILYAVECIEGLRKRNAYIDAHDTFVGDAIDSIIKDLT